jgi:peroxiredoxin
LIGGKYVQYQPIAAQIQLQAVSQFSTASNRTMFVMTAWKESRSRSMHVDFGKKKN